MENPVVYLLHFSTPISPNHTTQHYMGVAENLKKRLADHRKGQGSRLCAVAKERGIEFALARVWRGDRTLERKLKNQKKGPRLCPICNGTAQKLEFTLDELEELAF